MTAPMAFHFETQPATLPFPLMGHGRRRRSAHCRRAIHTPYYKASLLFEQAEPAGHAPHYAPYMRASCQLRLLPEPLMNFAISRKSIISRYAIGRCAIFARLQCTPPPQPCSTAMPMAALERYCWVDKRMLLIAEYWRSFSDGRMPLIFAGRTTKSRHVKQPAAGADIEAAERCRRAPARRCHRALSHISRHFR